jgi:hypothetical protein
MTPDEIRACYRLYAAHRKSHEICAFPGTIPAASNAGNSDDLAPNHAMTAFHLPRSRLPHLRVANHANYLSAAPERRDRTTGQRPMRASFANDRAAWRGPGVSRRLGRRGQCHAPALQGRSAGATKRVRSGSPRAKPERARRGSSQPIVWLTITSSASSRKDSEILS